MPIRRRAHTGDETGASTIELLVFFPLLLLIVLLTVQLALSWYGNEVAMSTAREVARSVRSGGGAGAHVGLELAGAQGCRSFCRGP